MRASSRPHARRRARWIEPASLTALTISLLLSHQSNVAEAKTPGSTYCFYGTCHRVKTLSEMEGLVGTNVTLSASYYDSCKRDRYNPCGLTSSGEAFDPDRSDNAASPIYPDGTTLLVWSPASKGAVVLRVNNAGPYWGGRKLDVSRATAHKLGFGHRGVAKLEVRIVDAPDQAESTYRRGRKYDAVRGYIGEFESIDAAAAGMTALMGLEAIASSMLAPLSGSEMRTTQTAFGNPFQPGKLAAIDVKALKSTSIASVEASLEMERLAATMGGLFPAAAEMVAVANPMSKALPVALALNDNPGRISKTAFLEPAQRTALAQTPEHTERRQSPVEKPALAPKRERVAAVVRTHALRPAVANRRLALATTTREPRPAARRHNERVAGPPNDHSLFGAQQPHRKDVPTRLASRMVQPKRAGS